MRAGYETENILAMTVTTVNRDKWKEFHTQALERVATVPGVKYAAFAWGMPLTGNKWPAEMDFPGRAGSPAPAPTRVELPLRAITQDYFKVMGMSLVEGREFRASDDNKAPRVIIVNEALVRRYFRGEQPIGRRIFFAGDAKPNVPSRSSASSRTRGPKRSTSVPSPKSISRSGRDRRSRSTW